MTTRKTILVTGAAGGFGKGAAIGMARNGYEVIATVHVSSQVTPLRAEVASLGLSHLLSVERLDLTDPYDVRQAIKWDFDVLWNNAVWARRDRSGRSRRSRPQELRGECLSTACSDARRRPALGARGQAEGKKVVFTSSMGGLFTPANWGTYVSTKHALESIAEALQQELAAYGVKVQTINPGAFYTGYNETMADNPFRWLDDEVNFTKRAICARASTVSLPRLRAAWTRRR
jgi:NAD(P)-dependent dehydrogenase (short-subunit alcohol dehydrogenase family)